MTNMYVGTSPLYTMVDKSKGSFTNRAECAKEHFKNNLAMNTKVAVLAGGSVLAVAAKPKLVTKVATKIGELLAKVPLFKKVISNPTKAGKIGLVAAVGLSLLHVIQKHTYKAGQIDQKYTDAAKIESQTKNIILEQQKLCAEEAPAKTKKGLYI